MSAHSAEDIITADVAVLHFLVYYVPSLAITPKNDT